VLNLMQKQAVTADVKRPVLVLAGAGSGKTRVLTYRIAWLLSEKHFAPQEILALTFTNKAALEMKQRVLNLLGSSQLHEPTLGTFHSVCVRILRREIGVMGYRNNFIIYDSDDSNKVIKQIHEELKIGKAFSPGFFKAQISRAKNLMQTPDSLDLPLDGRLLEQVREVYLRYQNFLHQESAVDFDDLLLLTIKIFQSFPKVLQRYKKKFKYILVDEYQDTNPAQFELLRLLVTNGNIFVVGDDAQSIYGFRGSDIRNILNFEQQFASCCTVLLEQNYRSTGHILRTAGSVIQLSPEQKPKTLWTENGDGNKVTVYEAEDERAEAEFVAKKIIAFATGAEDVEEIQEEPAQSYSILDLYLKKARRQQSSYVGTLPKRHETLRKYAVLYRTHAQSRALEETFIRAAIPYKLIGGIRFYERKEVKDFLAWVRLSIRLQDRLALERVINYPARGLGDKAQALILDQLLMFSGNKASQFLEGLPTFLPPKQAASARGFFESLARFQDLSPDMNLWSFMKQVYAETGFEKLLKDGTEMGDARVENVKELIATAKKYDSLSWHEGAELFMEEVALLTNQDEAEVESDYVTLLTLHSAKGLEFDTVFFVGLEEGLLPHSRSLLDPSELSEEVRLAYVGMTRARERLYLVYARQRFAYGGYQANLPSRFLKVLPSDSVHFVGGLGLVNLNDSEVTYEAYEF